ncbi:MAG TPA: response regulator [Candidatus Woesebacteria bacterium]|nr:response regulator [Candidatus Woesebacteria bacterium]
MSNVMIIEDNLSELSLYQQKLEEAGFTVFTEFDGQKGLEQVLKEKPHVLLLDMGLPHMSGLDVMKEIRKNMWGMTVPIIVLTEHDCKEEMLNEILQYKPSFYVVKSKTSADEVVEKVKKILGN